jgi:hypothetical protein
MLTGSPARLLLVASNAGKGNAGDGRCRRVIGPPIAAMATLRCECVASWCDGCELVAIGLLHRGVMSRPHPPARPTPMTIVAKIHRSIRRRHYAGPRRPVPTFPPTHSSCPPPMPLARHVQRRFPTQPQRNRNYLEHFTVHSHLRTRPCWLSTLTADKPLVTGVTGGPGSF